MAFSGIDEFSSRLQQSHFNDTGKGDARIAAFGGGGADGAGGQGNHRVNPGPRSARIALVPLCADKMAAKPLCHRACGAGAKKRVKNDIAGLAGGQQHAGQQRLGLLGRMGLAARRVLEAFGTGADRHMPVGSHLAILVAGLQCLVIESVALGPGAF